MAKIFVVISTRNVLVWWQIFRKIVFIIKVFNFMTNVSGKKYIFAIIFMLTEQQLTDLLTNL